MHSWDRLLPQAEIMLNMLLPTNIVLRISIYTSMHGQHDYNKMSLALMEWDVLLHNKPDIRKTWDNHAVDSFYIPSSQEHYRCFKMWVKNTKSIRVSDTVFFKHQYMTMPKVRKANVVVTNHSIKVLQGYIPTNILGTDQE